MLADLLLGGHAGQSVSIIELINHFFDVGVGLVPELPVKLLASVPRPQIHNFFVGLALVDFRRGAFTDGISLESIMDPFELVGHVPEALIGPQGDIADGLTH